MVSDTLHTIFETFVENQIFNTQSTAKVLMVFGGFYSSSLFAVTCCIKVYSESAIRYARGIPRYSETSMYIVVLKITYEPLAMRTFLSLNTPQRFR